MNDHFADFFSRQSFWWVFFSPEPVIIFDDHFAGFFFSPEPVIIFVDHFAGFFLTRAGDHFRRSFCWIFPGNLDFVGVRGAAETHSKTEFEANNAGSRHGYGIKPESMANPAVPWGRGGGGEEGSKGMGLGGDHCFPAKL